MTRPPYGAASPEPAPAVQIGVAADALFSESPYSPQGVVQPVGPARTSAAPYPNAPYQNAPLHNAPAHSTLYPPPPVVPPVTPGNLLNTTMTGRALAITALVLSILGVTFFPVIASIAAIIVGHLARKRIRETGEDGKGFASAAIAIGWLTIVLALAGAGLFVWFWMWASTLPVVTVSP